MRYASFIASVAAVAAATLGVGRAGATGLRPGVASAQDTTHHDASANGAKPKHSVGYNVGHSVKKAAKDTKNATTTAARNTGHEATRAGRNTKNEVHRDADRVSKATRPSKKPAPADSGAATP